MVCFSNTVYILHCTGYQGCVSLGSLVIQRRTCVSRGHGFESHSPRCRIRPSSHSRTCTPAYDTKQYNITSGGTVMLWSYEGLASLWFMPSVVSVIFVYTLSSTSQYTVISCYILVPQLPVPRRLRNPHTSSFRRIQREGKMAPDR